MKRILFCIVWCILAVTAQAQNSEKFNKACHQLNYGYEEGIAAFTSLQNDYSESERTRAQAAIVLANIYTNLGKADKLQEQIEKLQMIYNNRRDKSSLKNIPNLISDYRYTIKSLKQMNSPFIDRISGMWVSAEADENGCPWLVLHIGETDGKVWACIAPYCKFESYIGKGIYTNCIVANSESYRDDMYMYFGDVRFRSKDSNLLSSLSKEINSVSKAASESTAFKYRNKPFSGGNIGGQVAANIAGGIAQGVINELSVAKAHYYVCDIKGTFGQGEIARDVTIYYTDLYERSDESRPRQQNIIRKLNLYRVTGDDEIYFLSGNDRLVVPINWKKSGPVELFSREKASNQIDYAMSLNKKPLGSDNGKAYSIPAFNEYAYQKLKEKVMRLTKDSEIENELTYGALGYGYSAKKEYLNAKKISIYDMSGAYYRKDGNYLDSPEYYVNKQTFIRVGGEICEARMGPTMQGDIYKKIKNFIAKEGDKRKRK